MADDGRGNGNRPSKYKSGNMAPDGSYIVGKGRPPKQTQFASGDGRKRGRRPKGQKNFDTEFSEEAMRAVTIREGGKDRKVSKYRAAIMRAFDNAGAGGSNPAIRTVLDHAQKIEARRQQQKQQPAGDKLDGDADALLEAWFDQKVAERAAGANLGDPEDVPDDDSKDTNDD